MEQADEFAEFLTEGLAHTQPIGRVGQPKGIAGESQLEDGRTARA